MTSETGVPNWGLHTTAVHAGQPAEGFDVAPALHLSSTFHFPSAAEAARAYQAEDRPIYTRWGNPTSAVLEAKVAALEGGQAALATASGMAAISTALLTLLKPGDHLVAAHSLYGGTHLLVTEDLPRLGIETTLVEATDPQAFADAIRPNTRALYLESPGNPTLALTDLHAVAEIARAQRLKTLIDNTFATPFNQRPLEWGIDIAVHSATKYLGGHGDALGGVIVADAEFIEVARRGPLRRFGGAISPFNAWLIARGAQTLPLRMQWHNGSALRIAGFLAGRSEVAWVRYPWHESHPQQELAKRQMGSGGGGVLVFELRGGTKAGAQMLDRVRLCLRTASLGDTRTLMTHPASTTHHRLAPDARRAAGISDGLMRLSVGLEDPEDLIADLDAALAGPP